MLRSAIGPMLLGGTAAMPAEMPTGGAAPTGAIGPAAGMGGKGGGRAAVPTPQAPQPQPFTAAMTPASGGNVFQQSAQGLTGAMGGAQAAMGYQPQNITAQTAAGGIGTYMNPYTQQVIDASMADLERQRLMQQNQLGAQASAARAFGGSRQGIAEAETNRGFAQQGGQLAAQLRQQGFNTALGASQQDVANQMQAAQANQQAGLSGANLRMAGAGQLGNLAQQGFNMGQSIQQQQFQQGQAQQLINQALIDAARSQYSGFTGAPAASLSLPLAALGIADMGQQTQTDRTRPGLLNYLSAGLGLL